MENLLEKLGMMFASLIESGLGAFILVVLVVVLVIFILRWFNAWWFRINEVISLLESINSKIEKK